MTLQERMIQIEDEYKNQLDKKFMRDLDRTSRFSCWAGDLGFECDTYQALCILKGEERPPYTVRTKKIFRVGNVWEEPNYQLIKSAGIEIIDKIGFYKWKEKKISGKLDFRVAIPDPRQTNGKKIIVPLEHKTCSPNSFKSIMKHKLEGNPLTKSKHFWVRKYPGQLTMYDIMDGAEFGVFFFFEKTSGDYFFWIQPLDYNYGEELIQRAERCMANTAKEFIPKPEWKNECATCDFALTYCFPDRDFGPGFEIVDEAELMAQIKRMAELEKHVKEYNIIKKEVIGKKKNPGILYGRNMILGGRYIIESKDQERKPYSVPATSWKETSITDLDKNETE